MKAALRLLLAFAFAFTLAVALGGCGGVPYVVTAQSGQFPPRDATIQLAPLAFADTANRDGDAVREDPSTWADHTSAWSEKYQLRLLSAAKKKRLRVQPGVQPGAGLVLRATVVEIDKNASTYMGRDHITADVALVDASNQLVWSAHIEAASRGSGPSGYTFGGRIGWASETLANGIVDLLVGDPVEGSVHVPGTKPKS